MKFNSHVRRRAGNISGRKVGSEPGKGLAPKKMKCWVCGVPGHDGYECFRKEKAFCKVCKKTGHLPATCRRINRTNAKVSRQIHRCEQPDCSSDSEDEIAQQTVNVVEIPSRAHCRNAESKESVREYNDGEQQVAQHDIDSDRCHREWKRKFPAIVEYTGVCGHVAAPPRNIGVKMRKK